jgi:hypothetical protein
MAVARILGTDITAEAKPATKSQVLVFSGAPHA